MDEMQLGCCVERNMISLAWDLGLMSDRPQRAARGRANIVVLIGLCVHPSPLSAEIPFSCRYTKILMRLLVPGYCADELAIVQR